MKQKKINLGLVLASTLILLVVFAMPRDSQLKLANQITASESSPQTKPSALNQTPSLNLNLFPSAKAATEFAGTSIRVPVLMYHHIGPLLNDNSLEKDLTVSTSDFMAQVAYFKNKGYASVSLAQVYNALENQGTLPAKPIVFTFDDGFKDVFTNAIPVLEQNGYTGTFAVATELLGRPTYAVWDDVVAAQKAGMEIVSHTENHLDLTSTKYSDEDLKREIFGSKQILQAKLGTPIDFFVYPYGTHNQHVEDLVAQAGYKMALTTAFGLDLNANKLLLEPRLRVHGEDGLTKLIRVFEPWLFEKQPIETDTHTDTVPLNP